MNIATQHDLETVSRRRILYSALFPFESAVKFLCISIFLILFLFIIGASACVQTGGHPHRAIGIFKKQTQDGKTELTAIAEASHLALEKNMISMKMSTSREAAELMLIQAIMDMGAPSAQAARAKLKNMTIEFLEGARYCRIRVIYFNR